MKVLCSEAGIGIVGKENNDQVLLEKLLHPEGN